MLGGAFFDNLHDIISIDYRWIIVCGNLQIFDMMDDEILFEPVNPGILCVYEHIDVLEKCRWQLGLHFRW